MIVKKCCGVHTLRKVVGIMILTLLLAGSANAANLTVCPIGCEYSSIQKAINASNNGDIVLVQSGTYFENVNVTKQLTLRGIGNPVVDAGGSGSAITLAADGINLEGFTATGGGDYYDSPVAGIKVTSSLNMLTGNNASNNGYHGYGILLSSSSNNTLTGNSASNNGGDEGGGISLISSSNNTLSGNFASSNGDEDQVGSGISLSSSSNNNTLSGNIAWHNEETGISLSSSNNNTLFGNNANGNNNGITLSSSNNNTLTGNNALNNGGEEYGGSGISLFSSNNNKLTGNTASNNGELDQGGSGISLSDSNNNILTGNNALNNGGDDKGGSGISLPSSNNNFLIGNNANGNYNGITLSSSYNNALIGNIVSNNNVGIQLYNSNNNKIYNNIFKNTKNVFDSDTNINAWNTKKQSGTNIIGGPIIGGNFWGYPNGTGFSQTCNDMNNNGICEKRYILDENNIDYLPLSLNFTKDTSPPKSVSNLKNITYAKNYINWTWTDPKNIDFKTVMVFIDNKFKMNVSKGKMYYNATNLTVNTRHTISTMTVDMNGNINKTWKNSSAWTAK